MQTKRFIIETYKSIEKRTQRNKKFLKRHTYVDKDPQNHARISRDMRDDAFTIKKKITLERVTNLCVLKLQGVIQNIYFE